MAETMNTPIGVQQEIFNRTSFGHLCWLHCAQLIQDPSISGLVAHVEMLPSLLSEAENVLPKEFVLGEMLETDHLQALVEKLTGKSGTILTGLPLPKKDEVFILCISNHYVCFLQKGTQDHPDIWRFNPLMHLGFVQSSRAEFREQVPQWAMSIKL